MQVLRAGPRSWVWRRAYTRSASERLFRDALEDEKKAVMQKDPASTINEPVWTGDERMEDTVLRMLMDKYKPLRHTSDGRTAQAKNLENVQKPTELPISTYTPKETIHTKPYTPEGQPWNATFVRPSHASGDTPRVYRGRYATLDPPKSDMAAKLHQMGLSPSQLPLEDRKSMGQVRDSLRKSLQQDRIERVMDARIEYRREKGANDTKDVQDRPHSPIGTLKGLAGMAEQRIEEARQKGLFKENSLRGKPLPADTNESNPYIRREEFFLNRMIQRQGGMPPWVDLNSELMTDVRCFRQNIQQAWICRALLRLNETDEWKELSPVQVHWIHSAQGAMSGPDMLEYTVEATTPKEQNTLAWARNFRDAAWVREQASYHEAAVHKLNQTIRKYNFLAPTPARKQLYTKQKFLQSTLDHAYPVLLEAISARLRGKWKTNVSAQPVEKPSRSWMSWLRWR